MEPVHELRDIHLPEPIGWWPPALGWWISAGLLILAIGLILFWFVRRHRRLSIQRLALAELERIEHHYREHADNACFTEAISALLRRVAISVMPRHVAAGLTGQEWLMHLDELAGEPYFNNDLGQRLIHAAYRPDPDIDVDALLEVSRCWILLVSRRGRHA